MTLRQRLALGIAAILLVMLLPVTLSMRAMQELRSDTQRLSDVEFQAAVLLGRSRARLQEIEQTTNYLSLFPSAATRGTFLSRVDTLSRLVDSLGTMSSAATVPRMRAALETLREQSNVALQLAESGRGSLADSLIDSRLNPAVEDIVQILALTDQAIQEQTRERVSAIATASQNATRSAILLLGSAAVLAVLIGLWLTQSVSSPIDELESGMRAVAEGDFGHPLNIGASRKDEFGRLAASYNSMAMQLRELDRLKAEFISVASHELKTPINVITGYLQLLRENVYGPLSEKQGEIISTLQAQGKSLSKLVRGLLDVSRFEAGGGRIDPRSIDLPAFVGDLERTFRVLAIQRDVKFEVTRADALPEDVVWDPEQINEVMGNLLSNAFKFTPQNGEVRLDVRRQGEQVRMSVSDTGAGIPAAQLPYVFEKFYTADNQTTGLKGTGLGLAIAKWIVTAHGGSIGVESRVGVGTSFTILLPPRAAGTRAPGGGGGGPRAEATAA
ncbi:MAG: ATP-binding protein [Gemmatimonadota bacterium]